jgi:hypothetical protein
MPLVEKRECVFVSLGGTSQKKFVFLVRDDAYLPWPGVPVYPS